MKTTIFNLPLHEPIMGNFSSYRQSYKLKESKIQKILTHLDLPSSYRDRMSNVFEQSHPESFGLNYRINQIKSLFSSTINIDFNSPVTRDLLTLKPGDIRPSDECLSLIQAVIGCKGGLHHLTHSNHIALHLIIAECFDSISDRFPKKVDLLISLKESAFPIEFIKNLDGWDFSYDFNLSILNRTLTELFTSAQQGKIYKIIYPDSVASLISSNEDYLADCLRHFRSIGYVITPSEGGEVSIYWSPIYSHSNVGSEICTKIKNLLK